MIKVEEELRKSFTDNAFRLVETQLLALRSKGTIWSEQHKICPPEVFVKDFQILRISGMRAIGHTEVLKRLTDKYSGSIAVIPSSRFRSNYYSVRVPVLNYDQLFNFNDYPKADPVPKCPVAVFDMYTLYESHDSRQYNRMDLVRIIQERYDVELFVFLQ